MVLGGVITDLTETGSPVVLEHRQAPVMARRFTPLYRNSMSNKVSQQTKQRPNDIPVSLTVDPNDVVGVGSLVNFQIDNTLLHALRTIGVADQPGPEL